MSPASAYGLPSAIVFALGSAGLLMDPETAADTAAEVDEYRRQLSLLVVRNAELESLVDASGAAAEQRHQLLDPSEPPLGCFMTGDICAIAIADGLADPLAVDVPPAVTA